MEVEFYCYQNYVHLSKQRIKVLILTNKELAFSLSIFNVLLINLKEAERCFFTKEEIFKEAKCYRFYYNDDTMKLSIERKNDIFDLICMGLLTTHERNGIKKYKLSMPLDEELRIQFLTRP